MGPFPVTALQPYRSREGYHPNQWLRVPNHIWTWSRKDMSSAQSFRNIGPYHYHPKPGSIMFGIFPPFSGWQWGNVWLMFFFGGCCGGEMFDSGSYFSIFFEGNFQRIILVVLVIGGRDYILYPLEGNIYLVSILPTCPNLGTCFPKLRKCKNTSDLKHTDFLVNPQALGPLSHHLLPGKPTCPLKINGWKMYIFPIEIVPF